VTLFKAFAVVLAVGLACGAALAKDVEPSGKPIKELTLQQKREETLDILFGQLRLVSEGEAPGIEQKIWDVWGRPQSDTAGVLLAQATKAMNANDGKSARGILDQVIESYPSFTEGWNKRATLEYIEGNYAASLKDIEKVLEIEPRHFGALAGRGLILQTQEKWSEALAAYREALAINPNMLGVKDAIKELEKFQREI
jgi:tetratricopeptide (TPR) repeat protein